MKLVILYEVNLNDHPVFKHPAGSRSYMTSVGTVYPSLYWAEVKWTYGISAVVMCTETYKIEKNK
jgi:hypothetical protein